MSCPLTALYRSGTSRSVIALRPAQNDSSNSFSHPHANQQSADLQVIAQDYRIGFAHSQGFDCRRAAGVNLARKKKASI